MTHLCLEMPSFEFLQNQENTLQQVTHLELVGGGRTNTTLLPIHLSRWSKLNSLSWRSGIEITDMNPALMDQGFLENLKLTLSSLVLIRDQTDPTRTLPSWFWEEIQSLRHLETLEISGFDMSDVSLSYLFRPVNTVLLDTSDKLHVSIKDQHAWPPKLKHLDLSHNSIKGAVPEQLLRELEYLDLSNNNLNGTLPPMSIPSNITVLKLQRNNLTGPLDSSFGTLMPQLQELYLSDNQFVDTVPQSFAKLSNLGHVQLFGNDLDGNIEFVCTSGEKPKTYLVDSSVQCSCCIDVSKKTYDNFLLVASPDGTIAIVEDGRGDGPTPPPMKSKTRLRGYPHSFP